MTFRLSTLSKRQRNTVAAILVAVIAIILVAMYYASRRPVFGDGDVDIVCRETVVLSDDSRLITTASLTFSQDLGRYACTIKRGAGSIVVVDGVEGPEYDEAGCWEETVQSPQATSPRLPKVYIGITFSPDGSRVAYIAKRGGKELMVTDGAPGREYDEVGGLWGGGGNSQYEYHRRGPAFTSDGRHVAYRARRGDKWFMVADGIESPAYDDIEPYGPAFSADGLRLAYAAKRADKWFAVVDGIEGKQYDELPLRGLTFSSDSKHLSYAARLGDRWFAVRDGVEGNAYDYVKWLRPYFTYSPDGSRLVYNARREDKCFFVVDGVEQAAYDNVYGPLFGPQGSLLAYGAAGGLDQFVVTNGVEGKRYEDIESLTADSGGMRTAYVGLAAGQRRVVVDGVEGPPYDYIDRDLMFSSDGRRVVYVAHKTYRTLARFSAFVNNIVNASLLNFSEKDKWFVVLDGVEGSPYDSVEGLTISRDGRHLLYMATRENRRFIVVDGIEHPYPARSGSFGKSDLAFKVERAGQVIRVEVGLVDRKKR